MRANLHISQFGAQRFRTCECMSNVYRQRRKIRNVKFESEHTDRRVNSWNKGNVGQLAYSSIKVQRFCTCGCMSIDNDGKLMPNSNLSTLTGALVAGIRIMMVNLHIN